MSSGVPSGRRPRSCSGRGPSRSTCGTGGCRTGFELVVCDVDLRAGGGYRFVHRAPDGSQHAFRGRYREIERPGRLVSTFTYEAAPETEMLDEVTFEDNGGTTLVTGRTTFPTFGARELYAAAGAERGLAECHERLDERLEALAPPPREGHRR